MKKRFSSSLFLVLLTPMLVCAQVKDLSANKNSVKINLAGLILHNASLLYERSLNEHWSLQLGAGFRWGGDIPKAFGLGSLILTSNSQGVRGYSIILSSGTISISVSAEDPIPGFMQDFTAGSQSYTGI